MRILDSNEYINEKLAISPVTRATLADYGKKPNVDDATNAFIEYHNLKWNPFTKSYDCDKSIKITENDCVVDDGKFTIKFGNIKGNGIIPFSLVKNCRLNIFSEFLLYMYV